MLKKWKLQNFKSIYDSTELDLSPITVFAGANSSGKSTFIQSVLLVAQTISNQIFTRPIILNGHLMKFGSFHDLASTGSEDNEISISFQYIQDTDNFDQLFVPRRQQMYFGERDVETIDCSFSFSPEGYTESKVVTHLQPLLIKSKISTKLFNSEYISTVEIKRSNKKINERIKELNLTDKIIIDDLLETLEYEIIQPTKYKVPRYIFEGKSVKTKLVGANTVHFIPVSFSAAYDAVELKSQNAVNSMIETRDPNIKKIKGIESEYLNVDLVKKLKALIKGFLNEEIERTKSRIKYFSSERNKKSLSDEQKRKRAKATFMGREQRYKEYEKSLLLYEKKLKEINDDDPVELNKLINNIDSTALNTIFKNKYDDLVKISRSTIKKEMTLEYVPAPIEGYGLLNNTFTHLFRYLGPLRDEPKAVYPIEGASNPTDVGLKGEFTAAVLDLHKYTTIEYVSPEDFTGYGFKASKNKDALLNATQNWLEYLGVVNRIETKDQGVFGHELKIAPDNLSDMHNLLHVGVGVSQVLPILVSSLIADPGSLLIFEQPELHLHPKVQSRLADFFLSLAILNKQCIVESHSEYLVNRLRLRVAEDSTNELIDNISLYFVEKNQKKSIYSKVNMNEYGAILNWPKGFFDQAPDESEKILKAAYEKKKNEKNTT